MLPPTAVESLPGHLADNVVHFARVLRAAGVPVGTDRILLSLEALRIAGIASRHDLYATLLACLIGRAEHRLLFDQAFHVFWKDPDLLGQMMRSPPAQSAGAEPEHAPAPAQNRRLAEALLGEEATQASASPERSDERAAQLTWSAREQLRKADFDGMSTAEWSACKKMVASLRPFLARIATRRYRRSLRGARIDLRALLRASARRGGDFAELPRRERATRPEPLVVIVDISGSMSRYSRMFLHFLHAAANADLRVRSFVFGTRLTHITRQLLARDPDVAVAAVVKAVADWSGGTRIATCLKDFNVRWARRVLAGNPTVLLVTDGLESGDLELLAEQMERLAKSCRRLVWLNPLLRYEAFEPKARGIRAMLPFVDEFLPVHNIESLEHLAAVLAAPVAPARVAAAAGSAARIRAASTDMRRVAWN